MPDELPAMNTNLLEPGLAKTLDGKSSTAKAAGRCRQVAHDYKPLPQDKKNSQAGDAREDWGFLQMKTSNNAQVVRR